jgi:PAS domain-containing protein
MSGNRIARLEPERASMAQPADDARTIHLLVVEPEQPVAERIAAAAAGAWMARFTVRHCPSVAAVAGLRGEAAFDAILVAVPADLDEAVRLTAALVDDTPATVPIIALGAAPEDKLALPLIANGVEDYVSKSEAALQALPRIVAYAVQRRSLSARNNRLSHQQADIEALLTVILKAVRTPLVVTDATNRIIMSSPAMTACFGWAAADLVDRPIASFLARDTTAMLFRCADGSAIAVETTSLPIELEGRRRVVATFDPVGAYRPTPDAASGAALGAQLLAQLAERPGRLVAGHLQMVRLDAVRGQLGDRWEQAATRIYSTAEAVIRSRLAPNDVYTRNDDGDFIICFAVLDEGPAWYKARAIEREICEKLLGQGFSETLAATRLEAHVIPMSPVEIEETEDSASLLLNKLIRATDARNRNADRLLHHICETSDIRFAPLQTTGGGASNLAIAHFTAETEERLEQVPDAAYEPMLIGQVDLAMVGRVVEHVTALPRDSRLTCFIAPLRFSTLYHRGQRERLLAFLRQVPLSARKNLGFSVDAIQADVGAARTATLLQTLSSFGRLLMARLPHHMLGRHELDGSLVRIVTMSPPAFIEAVKARAAERMIEQIHDAKARLLVDEVPDETAAALAVQAGADLIGFARPLPPPKDAFETLLEIAD